VEILEAKMKRLATPVFIFVLIVLVAFFSYCIGKEVERTKPEPFPSIREFQVKIGAEPDGKLGKETEQCWRDRYYEIYGYWMY
jgi:hypothetical protein